MLSSNRSDSQLESVETDGTLPESLNLRVVLHVRYVQMGAA
jgi:hypothetical protein